LHIGSYLGALRQWAVEQHESDAIYCVVDLHSLTVEQDPEELRRLTLDTAIGLLACGLDPAVCTLFVQGHVAEHTGLAWLLECTVTFGELSRMTQFKSKREDSVRAGFFTYPALMAADILLYDTDRVPVGDDQRQHVELCRDVAIRFNNRYGETFVVPEAIVPKTGARVMDLQRPENKMSKSIESPQGTIDVLDSPEDVTRKIKRAVTDTDGEVRYDRQGKPGLANLLDIFAAATGRTVEDVASSYDQYGPLKSDLADAVVEMLRPVRERYEELRGDPGEVAALLAKGAAKATELAAPTLEKARQAIGLLNP
ncbi:MAG TPA: tryptophan--tRNA ligase, partial [Acidimicrobiales bacterium]|nr:tryptophan--tRNA ligase [Acidimicrobiales bacterium]